MSAQAYLNSLKETLDCAPNPAESRMWAEMNTPLKRAVLESAFLPSGMAGTDWSLLALEHRDKIKAAAVRGSKRLAELAEGLGVRS